MLTVVRGTRAEYRIMIKERKKRNAEALNLLQSQLEEALQDEKVVMDERISEKLRMMEDITVSYIYI